MVAGREARMIAGLPLDTWVLMVVSVVPGLVLVAMAYRAHRGDVGDPPPDRRHHSRSTDDA